MVNGYKTEKRGGWEDRMVGRCEDGCRRMGETWQLNRPTDIHHLVIPAKETVSQLSFRPNLSFRAPPCGINSARNL